jgi:hypothetical protein
MTDGLLAIALRAREWATQDLRWSRNGWLRRLPLRRWEGQVLMVLGTLGAFLCVYARLGWTRVAGGGHRGERRRRSREENQAATIRRG